MKKLVYSIMLLCCCVAAAFAANVDPSGFLIPEKAPTSCPSLDHVLITMKGTKATGWIQMKNQSRFTFATASLVGQHFTFRTVTVHGVSYGFDGKFSVAGKLSDTQPSGTVITGRLTRHGQSNATSSVTFSYTVGD